MAEFSLLTNHARVLQCIARDPSVRLRDIATCADITERAAHEIVTQLCQADYLSKKRVGARNSYEVHQGRPLRGSLGTAPTVGELLDLLDSDGRKEERLAAKEVSA